MYRRPTQPGHRNDEALPVDVIKKNDVRLPSILNNKEMDDGPY